MPAFQATRKRSAWRWLRTLAWPLLYPACVSVVSAEESPQAILAFDNPVQQHGGIARTRLEGWRSLIDAARELSDLEKLQRVNEFFNQVTFINDIDHWGVEDYWATPTQLLTSNGGDCEDFSIAKYFTLRQMGIPADHLRLTYVKALKLNQAHMVLTYFKTPGVDPLVLDNLVDGIEKASNRDDLLPVYSFNAEGLWLARERGNEQHIGKPERLSRWQEVVARINTEQMP